MIKPALYIYDRKSAASPADSATLRKKVLAEHLDVLSEALTFSHGPHGKPHLSSHTEYDFSVSHSADIWALVISSSAIGFDIERHKPRKMMDAIMSDRFHADECAAYQALDNVSDREDLFFKLWTQKEAYGKLLGLGLQYDFSSQSFLAQAPQDIHIRTYKLCPYPDDTVFSLSLASSLPFTDIEVMGDFSMQDLILQAAL